MKRFFKLSFYFFLILQISFILCNFASAHKVSTYAYREGDKIFGECYFVDGSPCKNSKVEVYDSKGKKIDELSTDERGEYSFTTKERGTIKVVISAGEGHRTEYTLEGPPEKREIKERSPSKEENKSSHYQASIDKEEIREIIDEALEVKLQGLRNEIMDLRKEINRVSLREIIGGIGYIVGVWAIIMLLKRKKDAS
ncbi:MAG: hypothetical protein ACK4Y7_06125 [Caldimicrobium sp.]